MYCNITTYPPFFLSNEVSLKNYQQPDPIKLDSTTNSSSDICTDAMLLIFRYIIK
jgi:hypothetical protein